MDIYKTLLELAPFNLQTEGGNPPTKPLYIHQIMSYESLFNCLGYRLKSSLFPLNGITYLIVLSPFILV